MIKTILIVFIFALNQTAFAGTPSTSTTCPDDVQEIHIGETANCDGLLLSPGASKRFDEALDDAKYYKALSDKLIERRDYTTKEINILDARVKLYAEQSQTLATELSQRESYSKWEKIGYFALGVIGTGIAIYGASQLKR